MSLGDGIYPGAIAAADLREKQYHFMRLVGTTERSVNQASLDTSTELVGILVNKPNTNEHASILQLGETFLIAGAAINANVFLTTNSSGRAVTAGSGDMVGARAVIAAGGDGDKIRVVACYPWRLA